MGGIIPFQAIILLQNCTDQINVAKLQITGTLNLDCFTLQISLDIRMIQNSAH